MSDMCTKFVLNNNVSNICLPGLRLCSCIKGNLHFQLPVKILCVVCILNAKLTEIKVQLKCSNNLVAKSSKRIPTSHLYIMIDSQLPEGILLGIVLKIFFYSVVCFVAKEKNIINLIT